MSSNPPNELGCFFWFVLLPIIVLSLIISGTVKLVVFLITDWFKSGDEMDKKRRITNIIGVVVLGTIILGVTTQRGIQWFQERERRQNADATTQQMADDLASALVNDGSGELVMKWARVEYVDVWGKPFAIEHSNKDKGVCIRSYGADGQPNTEDDILSRVFKYDQSKYEIKTRPADGKMGEIKERLEGAGRKAQELLKQAENTEVEAEKEKGWRFNFKWNWGGKDEPKKN